MQVKKPHIQVPKFILKSFSHKTSDGYKVFCLDLPTSKISEEKINDVGVGPAGYYPQSLEEHFAIYEQSFGEIKKSAISFSKNKSSFALGPIEIDLIFSFYDMMYERSEYFTKRYNEKSILTDFLGPISKAEMLSVRSIEPMTKLFSDILRKTHMCTLLINFTDQGYVAPRNCFYFYKESFIMPIAPKVAFIISPISEVKEIVDYNGYYSIKNPEHIIHLNRYACKTERMMNDQFVVGEQQSDLDSLILHNIIKEPCKAVVYMVL